MSSAPAPASRAETRRASTGGNTSEGAQINPLSRERNLKRPLPMPEPNVNEVTGHDKRNPHKRDPHKRDPQIAPTQHKQSRIEQEQLKSLQRYYYANAVPSSSEGDEVDAQKVSMDQQEATIKFQQTQINWLQAQINAQQTQIGLLQTQIGLLQSQVTLQQKQIEELQQSFTLIIENIGKANSALNQADKALGSDNELGITDDEILKHVIAQSNSESQNLDEADQPATVEPNRESTGEMQTWQRNLYELAATQQRLARATSQRQTAPPPPYSQGQTMTRQNVPQTVRNTLPPPRKEPFEIYTQALDKEN
ncbi:MAG: hypothetical protein AAF621_03670 [Pseudomonadota bacterium]